MALSRVKTWIAGEVLTASDLNNEFNNVLNNALALISPLTGNLDFNNNKATNFRFEVQSATQAASQQGRAYYQSTEASLHIDSGSVILRVPAIAGLQAGDLIGAINPTGVSGATLYSRIQLGTGLSLDTTTGILTGSASSGGSGNPIQSAVFN
jgi:hypothetical protein